MGARSEVGRYENEKLMIFAFCLLRVRKCVRSNLLY